MSRPQRVVARWIRGSLVLGLVGCGGMPADKVDRFGLDLDRDGFPQTDESGAVVDCDDTNPLVYPGSAEACDGLDNDCDGSVDGPPSKGVDARQQWWPDSDGDGFGDRTQPATRTCDEPADMTDNNEDCDDSNAAASPSGREVCDGVDNDCNGYADDAAADELTWYRDSDGDGYGNDEETEQSCDEPPGQWSLEGGDCRDGDGFVSPGEPESCDGIDNDCDDEIDEEPPDGTSVWVDADGDGYGDPETGTTVCDAEDGDWVDNGSDCDDTDSTVFPGSTETEVPNDGVDQNCDGNDFCTDLDCDGLPDLVVPWYGSSPRATQALLSGGVRFGESVLDLGDPGYVGDALVSDLDSDGYPDVSLAIGRDASGTSFTSAVYLGPFLDDGSGPAAAGVLEVPVLGAGKLAAGDFDDDGQLDVVVGATEGDGGHLTVFFGGDAGADPDVFDADVVAALHVADLNQDDFDDLVVCQSPPVAGDWGYELTIYLGSPTGLAEGPAPSSELDDCVDIAAANLDGDPELELVLARDRAEDSGQHSSVWADADASGAYGLGGTFSVAAATSVQLVDLDQDGNLDAVFGAGLDEGTSPGVADDTWDTSIAIYMGTGSGLNTTAAAELPGSGSSEPIVADFDGDGFLDILAPGQQADGGTPVTRVYLSESGGFSAVLTNTLSWSPWVHGAVADTNGDGLLDVLRFSRDPTEGLVRHNGSSSGQPGSGASLLPGGTAISPPLVVQ